MISTVTRKYVPDVSAEQLMLDQTRKQLRKLCWIGREEEADRMLLVLSDARLRPPVPGERRNKVSSVVMAKDLAGKGNPLMRRRGKCATVCERARRVRMRQHSTEFREGSLSAFLAW
jgi:hypothetical protein